LNVEEASFLVLRVFAHDILERRNFLQHFGGASTHTSSRKMKVGTWVA
jgi:hypothetical protein